MGAARGGLAGCIEFQPADKPNACARAVVRNDVRLEQIGLADEVGHKAVARRVIDLLGAADLLQAPGRHHCDAVGHGQRLLLIVGDEDEGDPGLALDLFQLDPHLLAQLEVEGREGLVEQQQFRLWCQRSRQGNPLLLATRKLAGPPRFHGPKLHEIQHGIHPFGDIRLVPAQHTEAETDILRHRQMREQRVILEHRVDGALIRGQVRQRLAIEPHLAAGQGLEPGHDPQQRGLAATGGAEEGEELIVQNIQRHVLKGHHLLGATAICLVNAKDVYCCHHDPTNFVLLNPMAAKGNLPVCTTPALGDGSKTARFLGGGDGSGQFLSIGGAAAPQA
jgi:hypothetical protein